MRLSKVFAAILLPKRSASCHRRRLKLIYQIPKLVVLELSQLPPCALGLPNTHRPSECGGTFAPSLPLDCICRVGRRRSKPAMSFVKLDHQIFLTSLPSPNHSLLNPYGSSAQLKLLERIEGDSPLRLAAGPATYIQGSQFPSTNPRENRVRANSITVAGVANAQHNRFKSGKEWSPTAASRDGGRVDIVGQTENWLGSSSFAT